MTLPQPYLYAGVDFSVHSLDIVLLPLEGNTAAWHSFPLAKARGIDQARAAKDAMPLSSFFDDVVLCALEKPMSPQRNSISALMRLQGVVAACVPPRVLLWELPPYEWKQQLGLPGNARKPEVAGRVFELWADPPDVVTQDAVDAFAVAWAARAMNERAVEVA